MAGPYFGSFGARGHQPTSFGPRDTRGPSEIKVSMRETRETWREARAERPARSPERAGRAVSEVLRYLL